MSSGFGSHNAAAFDGTLNPAGKCDGRVNGAPVRFYEELFDLSLATVKKVSGDTNFCFRIRAGEHPMLGWAVISATLATTTVEIGTLTTAGRFRASAVLTTINAPQFFMIASAADDDPLTDYIDVYIKFTTADAPGAGTINVCMLTSGR